MGSTSVLPCNSHPREPRVDKAPGTCHRHHRAQRIAFAGKHPTADRKQNTNQQGSKKRRKKKKKTNKKKPKQTEGYGNDVVIRRHLNRRMIKRKRSKRSIEEGKR